MSYRMPYLACCCEQWHTEGTASSRVATASKHLVTESDKLSTSPVSAIHERRMLCHARDFYFNKLSF